LADVEARIEVMDANGIDMHLLSLGNPGVQYFTDTALATSLAAKVNDSMAALIRRYPARLAGLAAIAPQDPAAAAAEIKRAVTDLGLHGVLLNSHTHGEWLDMPKFYPILEALEKYQTPLYLHPGFPPDSMMQPLQDYGMYASLWGFAAECGLHAVRMILGGVFDRFPGLQVVLGHAGEGIPFFLYRLDDNYRIMSGLEPPLPGLVKLKRTPSEYVKQNMYITMSGMFWNELLDFCIKAVGLDRIMFAVDYPYVPSNSGAHFLLNAPIPAEQKEKIGHRTAEKVFKIKS
jgi:predicted TIM-barrel fold metal-dependent hydrolase